MKLSLSFCLLLLLALHHANAVTKTILEFKRPMDTCDSTGDVVVEPSGTARVVYAYGSADPISPTQAAQHSVRGAKSVNLASAPTPAEPTETDVKNLDFRFVDVSVPAVQTYYHCQGFNISNVGNLHVVQFQPIINANHPDYIHHILVYECDTLTAVDLAYSGNCQTNNVPQNLRNCNFNTLIAAWAVGGATFNYPPSVGYPIGGNAGKYALMEIHYNNPTLTPITDNSGMRFKVTAQLRPNVAGIMLTGMPVDPNFLSIPANQAAYDTYGGCMSDCTATTIPQSGINVFATFLHGHLAATGVSVYRLTPNGTQLPSIDENPSYDFEFQDVHNLPSEVKVSRGENLVVKCTYNTQGRTTTTNAGLGTNDEMCLAFLFYYPRVNALNRCVSAAISTQNFVAICDAIGSGLVAAPQLITPLPSPPPCTTPPTSTTSSVTTRRGPVDLSVFVNSQYMDANNKFKLYWYYNKSAPIPYLHFAAEVETSGWVGVGISPNGDMTGSDIFFGWVDANGDVFAQDRKANSRSLPAIDARQDIYDVVGYEVIVNSNTTSSAFYLIASNFLVVALVFCALVFA